VRQTYRCDIQVGIDAPIMIQDKIANGIRPLHTIRKAVEEGEEPAINTPTNPGENICG